MSDLCSIVVATYNQAHFLRTSLLSCLNQTYPNCEVIVVPVQGDIETFKVLREFKGQVRVFISDKADYVWQRNLGVQHCNGEWYCFMDSDDFMLPSKVESDLEVAIDEDALLVYSGYLVADEKLRINQGIIPPDFSREKLLQSCIITDFSLVHRKLYKEFGPYREELGEVAFYDFYLQVAEHYPERIKLNKTPTFIYRQHEQQMWRQLSWDEKIRMRQKVQQESLKRKHFKWKKNKEK